MSEHATQPAVQQRFEAALQALVERIRHDRSILAVILCGSLSHDRVWEKSDIDLVLITIDEKSAKQDDCAISLYADHLNVHGFMLSRTQFRKTVEASLHNSFIHSLLAKGRLLYTHDESIAEIFARLEEIGARDTGIALLQAATAALPAIYKAHKWLVTRGDLNYTALWILWAATPLAKIAVIRRGLVADREVIPQALTLEPELFDLVYTRMLNSRKTRAGVEAALDAVDRYLSDHIALFDPIIEHLREVGEARSCTEIEDHFERNFGIAGVTTACEYLSDQGLIGKASVARRITKRSNIEVQEMAFVYLS